MNFHTVIKWGLVVLVALAGRTGVAGTLAGSAHDFSTKSWNASGSICVTCHTAHKSDRSVSDAPLWSHTTSTATYQLYTSSTFKGTADGINGNSKLCLSCHDGTVAVDSFGGQTGSTMISGSGFRPASNIGTDLRDDHPIGFDYASVQANDASIWPGNRAANIGSGSQLKNGTIATNLLFNGKMECASCHDVHNTFTVGSTGMLKMAAQGGAICLACHNK